jgi:uncharacterized protein (TIGR02246 family)
MKRFATLCSLTTIALAITACNQMPDSHDADIKALQANDVQWNQDFVSKDTDRLASHYSDDAVLMITGSPAISGKEAIRAALKQMVADPAMSLKLQTTRTDVAKSGDLAYTQGTYTLIVTDPQTKQVVNDHGNFVTTFRKQADGTWKAVADIASSDVPPPVPAPSNP